MDQSASKSGRNNPVPDKMDSGQLAQRRKQAILMFQRNPEHAIRLYPELESDLIGFYAISGNPYLNPNTGLPIKNMEADYELWEAAHQWAVQRSGV